MTDTDAALWEPASGNTNALFVPDNNNSFHTSEMVAGFSHKCGQIVGYLWSKANPSTVFLQGGKIVVKEVI